MTKRRRRPGRKPNDELTRRLLAFLDDRSETDALGRDARQLAVERRWSEMGAHEQRFVRRYRADIDRRLAAMIDRYRSPGRASPDA
jgi:hypothetical protein